MGNIVAIVGRPNVGKSTLFNRLTESREAIVDQVSGVTRDRHYGKSEWNGKEFSVIDTGGLVEKSSDIFEKEIRKQVMIAIEEADVILFLVDVENGITDLDEAITILLRKVNKPVFLVVNKVDINQRLADTHEFHRLGLGELYPISSINGSGTGELLDAVVVSFQADHVAIEEEIPRFAVVGRPNVGKSTLINSLIGQERNIVTPIAGTTRDSIFTRYNKYNHDFYLIDTAGLRKKGKVQEDIEFYSVLRSIRAIETSDVCLLLIDATLGMEGQDMNILRLIIRNRKGVVILVNKWDLVEKENQVIKKHLSQIKEKIAPFQDVPIIFVSAINKQRIFKVLEEAMEVYGRRIRRIPTNKLNEVMLQAVEDNPPPANKGKYIRIKYVTQLPTHAPTFAFFANLPQYIKDPYRRYLENKLRNQFDFTGVPIQIFFRKK
ncbi:MAG: ribosome biogenesis GTPase Der [Bacteroidales bacterium]|nr:ribosome biogenesis GTPase Der [Bacteroidales bacterium]